MANNNQQTATDLCALATQQIARREYTQAFNTYQQATKQYPTHTAAYAGIARLLQMHGNYNQALQALSYALRIEPNNSALRQQMIPLLATLSTSTFNHELERDLLLCLDETGIDHQQLARVTASLLWAKYHSVEITVELLETLNKDALLLRYLSCCINTHAKLELWLTQVRKTLLIDAHQHNNKTVFTTLACAIALACFANEYVFDVSEEELQILQTRESQDTTQTPAMNDQLPLDQLVIKALYKLLFKLSAQQFTSDNEPLWSLLLERSLSDLQEENLLKNTFSKITNYTSDSTVRDISALVQSQYEENPYPRWQIPPAPTPIAIPSILQQLPAADTSLLPTESCHVLIAGCGTGYEPIDLARTDSNANITALDLSSSSLAYAKRMANKLSLNNINFVQGNILDAEKLNQSFDLINSTGVLHHMENPQAGWQVLCNILKPGGVMRISLYSEYARKRIVFAHQRIKDLGLTSSTADIKKFRKDIFQQPTNSSLGELAQSDDFYSVSGCRDLLFHVQEHRFTLPQLKSVIHELGLTLIGFDVPLQARNTFQQRYQNSLDLLDLDKWHEFETAFPDTFVGMYQLWLQKKGA